MTKIKEKIIYSAGESVMIKSLLEQDEKQPDEFTSETKQTPEPAIEEAALPDFAETHEPENPPESFGEAAVDAADETEIDNASEPERPKSAFEKTFAELLAESSSEPTNVPEPRFNQFENLTAETSEEPINSQIPDEIVNETANFQTPAETAEAIPKFELPAEMNREESKNQVDDFIFQPTAPRESFAETARNSGLAYAAAITLFGAVVFMLVIGWFVDLLLGSSPWGIVGGIVLGAAIGFFQFFRMTAQIFKGEK